jgi:hypothetical protein
MCLATARELSIHTGARASFLKPFQNTEMMIQSMTIASAKVMILPNNDFLLK